MKMVRRWLALSLICLSMAGCGKKSPIPVEKFGKLPDGRAVKVYTLKNANGMTAKVMNYGATLISLKVADNMGQFSEVTLGFDSLAGYLRHPRFGSIVGRYGNRIAKGKFSLNGQEYTLAVNNGPNHLHGGKEGFDKKIWKAEPFIGKEGEAVAFTYISADGEEGYPGRLTVKVTYTVRADNCLKIDYEATTTKPTVLNLTNHTYFNLKDAGKSDVLGHFIKINASRYTPIDETKIPTGELAPVEGTPFDFRRPQAIGTHIHDDHPQIKYAGGYDHNWVLDEASTFKHVATVFEPTSGRVLNVITTEPGVQFYTGNFMNGFAGRDGAVYQPFHGFCLETQHFPDSPNHANFPSTVLNPEQVFRSSTLYKFSVAGVSFEVRNIFF
ncbi:MAG: galactose mutarotase [candidate division KSB1 bacterium]|nr:galactose mutarotase [candidate division KSB1 bacterium]MDZ7346905.1 galactose mutarotase [candidate division KSB1 bacterium]